jgi:fructokinase
MAELFGGIEAGGTKFVCAVAEGPQKIHARVQFSTQQPDGTIQEAIRFLQQQERKLGNLTAIGIGSFGPVDLDPNSPTYGNITSTPKPGWENTGLVGSIKEAFNLPVGFDTDVNAAALGEFRWGAAQGLGDFIYLTVGTGIGGGAMINGALLHGLLHPEMGHMLIPHDFNVDPFPGSCPYHADCLEGLANGPAIEKRWGQPGETLPEDHPAWPLEAHYLALGAMNLTLAISPQRIIMGGGVMKRAQLFPLLREKLLLHLNRYITTPDITQNIDTYVVPPGLGDQAGIMGAIALAQRAASLA